MTARWVAVQLQANNGIDTMAALFERDSGLQAYYNGLIEADRQNGSAQAAAFREDVAAEYAGLHSHYIAQSGGFLQQIFALIASLFGSGIESSLPRGWDRGMESGDTRVQLRRGGEIRSFFVDGRTDVSVVDSNTNGVIETAELEAALRDVAEDDLALFKRRLNVSPDADLAEITQAVNQYRTREAATAR